MERQPKPAPPTTKNRRASEPSFAAGTIETPSVGPERSLSDAVQTRDLWTFRRAIGSRDPNWLLIETDEEE